MYLNNGKGRIAKEGKTGFGNLPPRPPTSFPLYSGNSPRLSLRSLEAREEALLLGKAVLCPFPRLPVLTPPLNTPPTESNV